MNSSKQPTDKASSDALAGGGGMPALEGYFYQIDISVLAALDTLIVKKMSDRLVLEPVGQDDLEADLLDLLSASATTDVDSADYRIVVQAKYRGAGVWKPSNFADLLNHGKKRPSALKRLEDARTRYLLITTGAADTGIQELLVKNIGQWPRKAPSNANVAGLLSNGAHRRVAILQWSEEVLKYKLEEYLERNCRVPRPNVSDCLSQLRSEALDRMRGARGGMWTRREIQELIRQHQGYFASATEIELYVRPGKWPNLVKQIKERYAVIIVGPSGTGKTTTATVLADKLQEKYPGIEIKHIINGPGEISTDNPAGPVIYLVDDPWGKYRVGPNSEPWNDEIGRFLSSASANKYFIVTSRSDVFASSRAKLTPNWFVELEPEDYGPQLRLSILEKRLQKMPRRLQDLAYPQKRYVTDELTLPLEIAKYVQSLAEGPGKDEKPDDFLRRALHSAKNETIEGIVAQQVSEQDAHPWAAVVWGVFKAGPNVERSIFGELQSYFADMDQSLDDGLEHFVTFLENGHSLRHNERLVSYYHPRVEAGLQAAIVEKPARSRRILGMLADSLMIMHQDNGKDWAADACASMMQAAREVDDLAGFKPRAATVAALDGFLVEKLLKSEKNYVGILRLAANAMSADNDIAVLCRWLLSRKKGGAFGGFPPQWDPTPIEVSIRQRLVQSETVITILRKFVLHALPHDAESYPDDTWKFLVDLDHGIAKAFVEVAGDSIGVGYFWNLDAVASGAAQDLDAFWLVVQESLDHLRKLADQPDDGTNLAIYNGEYSDDYAEHLSQTENEEGYSANEYIQAYVAEYRRKHGWKKLIEHPRISDMGRAWLKAARADSMQGPDEILQLAAMARNASWEDAYWYFAEQVWSQDLDALLLDRVSTDISDHHLRELLIKTGLRCLKDGVNRLVGAVTVGGDRQILIALDDARGIDDKDLVTVAEAFAHALLDAAAIAVKDAFQAMSSKGKPAALPAEASALISGMSRPNYPSWQLRRARLLAASGIDVAGLIDDLMTTEEDSLSRTIPAASGAVELAAELRLDAVVDSALSHRYAGVRITAMNIVAQRSSGELPVEILDLVEDKGSGVKTALLDLIEARPGQYAIKTLIQLVEDRWSSANRYYGEDAHFDIAQKAGDLLAITGDLGDEECHTLMEVAAGSDDEVLARKLYCAIARRGGASGERLVLDFALTRGKVRPKTAALNALAEQDKINAGDMLDRANGKEIAERASKPAALLAYLVGSQASEPHALAVGKEIAVDTKRAAMLFPLWIGAHHRGGELPTKVEALFPAGIMTEIRAIEAADGVLPRTFLNSLGDPETIDGIIRAFPHCFEKKPKA